MVWFRIWGANCENVGSTMPICQPEGPSSPSCEAAASEPCAEFYYGAPNCSVFCRPSDSCLGHYSCSSSGSRVCLAGWTGPNCRVNVATQSSECTCLDGGTWLNGECVGEVTAVTTPADGLTASTTTQSLVIRIIYHIKTNFPTLSQDQQLQLLAVILQQLLGANAAAAAEPARSKLPVPSVFTYHV